MPIRINLLAEAQAAEEIRRRDPVKRAIWIAVLVVLLVLAWSSSLQVELMSDNSKVNRLEASLGSRTNQYTQILDNRTQLGQVESKLAALHNLATNRFLNADVLNAFQHATSDGIQITRLRTEQSFMLVPEIPSKKVDEKFVPGKPGSSTEKILLTVEGKDTSPNPGNEAINRYKETLAHNSYFQKQNISTNQILLKNLSSPQMDNESGASFVVFSFECQYPTRSH